MSNRDEMLIELPQIFRDSPEYQEMVRVKGIVFDRLESHVDDVLDNFFIDSATWGLSIMEEDYKIPTDITKPLEHRRSALKAKKRGIGTVSASMIKNVAESFQNGSVEAKAIKGESKILITFNDVFGIPPNLEDIKEAIRKILLAHRIVDFEFRYLLIRDVEAMTLAELESTPLNKFAGGA